ncbi:MAG: Na(+)-translocating NADH-quinone reductase subunit A [Saprospiraceae bacterium]|nr:Na(+)-translocating NADH-quinone reductase subunit A [Saprospiraceae bacterium]
MKSGIIKLVLPAFLLLAQIGHAQTPAPEKSDSNWFVYGLAAISLLIVIYIIVQVSENLMAIEAKRLGADKSGANFSLFPQMRELFDTKRPAYLSGQPLFSLRRGFDIKLEGEAPSQINAKVKSATYALMPANFRGIFPIPKMEVEVGSIVKAGDPLFHDKSQPEIKYAAPVSGEIVAINRGEKRAIKEVVILADMDMKYREFKAPDPGKCTREELVAFLLDSGVWPMIRQRPFDVTPAPEDVPRDIFISTFDTAPLAPDLNFVVEGRGEAFQKGLDVLGKLTVGKVYLGLDARGDNPPSAVFTQAAGVEKYWFRGKHPAGNVGIQIHHIKPINTGDKVWVMGVQEVITLGTLFTEGRFDTTRVVAVTGAELETPQYVKTHLGANLSDLLKGNLKGKHVRIISGDVLTGEHKAESAFLNYWDDQVTVIEEGDYFELFGWLIPGSLRPTLSRTYPNFLVPGAKFRADSNTHGEKRAFVVTGQYEQVLPMDLYPQHLMKAILAGNFEKMEGLGILELSEEDIALCEFACTSKQPLQHILRQGLDMMSEQS